MEAINIVIHPASNSACYTFNEGVVSGAWILLESLLTQVCVYNMSMYNLQYLMFATLYDSFGYRTMMLASPLISTFQN